MHRDHVDDAVSLHHAIHVNVEPLISNDTFIARLNDILCSLEPIPKLIVSPPHPAGRLLARLAANFYVGDEPDVCIAEHSNLLFDQHSTSEHQALKLRLGKLRENDAILILDDAFITGYRLSEYQRNLRDVQLKAKIHYVAAIARPDDLAHWEQRRRMFAYRQLGKQRMAPNTAQAVETVVLPRWKEDRCPWCLEIALYERMYTARNLPSFLMERMQLLKESRVEGLRDNLFLRQFNHPNFEIRNDSIFCPSGSDAADVFVAVAGSIQTLRTIDPIAAPKLGLRRFPIATVLNAEEYLRNTFNDSILRACFLRSCHREELVYTDRNDEKARTDDASALINSTSSHTAHIAFEIALASALGKFGEKLDIKCDQSIFDNDSLAALNRLTTL